jgi:hypothetical protein
MFLQSNQYALQQHVESVWSFISYDDFNGAWFPMLTFGFLTSGNPRIAVLLG